MAMELGKLANHGFGALIRVRIFSSLQPNMSCTRENSEYFAQLPHRSKAGSRIIAATAIDS